MPDVATLLKRAEQLCVRCELDQVYRDKINDLYFKYAKDEVVATIVDYVATHTAALTLFTDIMNGTLSETEMEHLQAQSHPFVIFTPDKLDHLRVFQNITIDGGVKFDNLDQLSILNVNTLLSEQLKAYERDKSGEVPGGMEKWKNKERIIKRISTYVDVPTGAALTRYFGLEAFYKSDQIRDLAIKIDSARKPMELLYADKPADFMDMYSHIGPSSCMTTREAFGFMQKHKVTATSFYAYFPYTRGAYLKKKGKVVARTVLWCDPEQSNTEVMGMPDFDKSQGKGWKYGYIYASTTQDHQELIKALKSNGILQLAVQKGNNFTPPANKPFQIPGFDMGNGREYGCPFPFFDDMDYHGAGFVVEFDNTTKMFTLCHGEMKDKQTMPVNSTTGYLNSSHYIKRQCAHCDKISSGNWITSNDTGLTFCSTNCIKDAGYKQVHQGNATTWIKVEDESIFVKANNGALFTNLMAAGQNGYYMPMKELGVYPEEGSELLTDNYNYRLNDLEGNNYAASNYMKSATGRDITQRDFFIPIVPIKFQKEVRFEYEPEGVAA